MAAESIIETSHPLQQPAASVDEAVAWVHTRLERRVDPGPPPRYALALLRLYSPRPKVFAAIAVGELGAEYAGPFGLVAEPSAAWALERVKEGMDPTEALDRAEHWRRDEAGNVIAPPRTRTETQGLYHAMHVVRSRLRRTTRSERARGALQLRDLSAHALDGVVLNPNLVHYLYLIYHNAPKVWDLLQRRYVTSVNLARKLARLPLRGQSEAHQLILAGEDPCAVYRSLMTPDPDPVPITVTHASRRVALTLRWFDERLPPDYVPRRGPKSPEAVIDWSGCPVSASYRKRLVRVRCTHPGVWDAGLRGGYESISQLLADATSGPEARETPSVPRPAPRPVPPLTDPPVEGEDLQAVAAYLEGVPLAPRKRGRPPKGARTVGTAPCSKRTARAVRRIQIVHPEVFTAILAGEVSTLDRAHRLAALGSEQTEAAE
jgi:hypothetical protein